MSLDVDYGADAKGRMAFKSVGGSLVKRYIYDEDLRLVGETAASTFTRYVYTQKTHSPSYMIRSGTRYKFITNEQGSVRFVINDSTGTIEQEMNYDEFGRVTLDTNPGFQSFGFAGGVYDTDTKLTRFGARDYHAKFGRWTAKDPIRFEGKDTNLYGYAFNDPINYIDVNGEIAWFLPVLVGAGILFNPLATDTPNAARDRNLGDLSIIAGGAGGELCKAAKNGGLLGKRSLNLINKMPFGQGGFLNKGRNLRIGVGCKGGDRVFRIGGDYLKRIGIKNGKIDLIDFGPK